MSAVQYVVTYMGISTVVIGVIGNILNLLVFLSLKTFRESPCTFYLIVMSIVNIGNLITGQFSRVMITGFGIDWTTTSVFYCKLRPFGLQVFSSISLTCICLAIIDQYLATCIHAHWQRWSNIKSAQRLSMISIIVWIIYAIPYLIFYDQIVSPTSGSVSCTYSNMNFRQYHIYVNNVILSGGLPVLITMTFGILAYKNVRQITYRTVPLIRRELDKQLTNMVLIQITFSIFVILPYFIMTVLPLATNINSDPIRSAQFTLAVNTGACIYYWYFAYSFYIYVCVSKRFRQQLIYVLFELHFNRWRKPKIPINQIVPQSI